MNCDVHDFAGYAKVGVTLDELHARMLDGESLSDLLRSSEPGVAGLVSRNLSYLRSLEQQVLTDRWSSVERDVRTLFLFGPAGVGKTSAVYAYLRKEGLSGPDQVFVVSDYQRDPFGGYSSQRVLFLDDFRLSEFVDCCSFSMVLRLLDRYPVQLPRRYSNLWAAYDFVILTANTSPKEQMDGMFGLSEEDKHAFYRRLTHVVHVDSEGRLHDETGIYHKDLPREAMFGTAQLDEVLQDDDQALETSTSDLSGGRPPSSCASAEQGVLPIETPLSIDEIRERFDVKPSGSFDADVRKAGDRR